MNSKNIVGVGFLITLVLAAGFLLLSPAGIKQAPPVAMQSIDGQMLSLADYEGRPVLVSFWATTCPGCIKEMPHLVELYHEYADKGFEIIGVAMAYDIPSQVVSLVKARQLPYRIVLDLDSEIAQAYGDVRLTPTTFLVAPDGRIVQEKIGDMDLAKLRQQLNEWLS